MAVLFISSELAEIIGVCKRVIVMREGVVMGEVGGETGVEVTQQNIMKLATGASQSNPSPTMASPSSTQDTVNTVARKEVMRSIRQVAGMLPVLIVICILFAFLTESFLTTNNLINVVRQASINIVLAAGMTFGDPNGRHRSRCRLSAWHDRRALARVFSQSVVEWLRCPLPF